MPKLLLASLLALLAVTAEAANELYCCQEAGNGRRICSDTLPEQCRGRPYRVFDNIGNIIREVSPPMTPEEKAQQAAEQQRKKQQEEAAREQQRRDQALLDTYANLQDIDASQTKAENDVNLAIAQTQEKIDLASKKRRKLQNEAEFYKKRSLPADLDRDLRAVEYEIKVEKELLDVKKHDFDTIRTKYGSDRQRYIELTSKRRPATAPH